MSSRGFVPGRTSMDRSRTSSTTSPASAGASCAWKALTSPWQLPRPTKVNVAKGCLECRMTGYMGRVGIYEMMMLTPAVRALITAETDVTKLREQAMRDGMKPLRVSGALKIAAGLTTLEEVMKVAPPASGDGRAV